MNKPKLRKPTTLGIILRTAIVSAVVLLVEHHVAIDNAIADAAWAYRRAYGAQPAKPITVVMLDDSVISDQPVRNPYPREILRKILAELDKAKPACVVLDVFLVDEFDAKRDQALADQIRKSGNVYLAIPTSPGEGGKLAANHLPEQFDSAARETGISVFSAAHDGRVRAFESELPVESGVEPHLISAVGEHFHRKAHEEQLLDYGIDPERAIHFISARDLIYPEDSGFDISSKDESKFIRDNVVIVGPFDSYSPDLFASANDRWNDGVIRGSELLALGIQTIRSPKLPNEVTEPWGYLLALAFYVISWISQNFLLGHRGWKRFALLGACSIAMLVIGLLSNELFAFVTLAIEFALLSALHMWLAKVDTERTWLRRVAKNTFRWFGVLAILAAGVFFSTLWAFIIPTSLAVAGWILGWEAGELYIFEGMEFDHHATPVDSVNLQAAPPA